MKRQAEETINTVDNVRKERKNNEQTPVGDGIACFPIEITVLDKICSFSDVITQCSLYATCSSIRKIIDDESFPFHYHSRRILMMMKQGCQEFTSEVDRRNFFYGICYRLNSEIIILDKEMVGNGRYDRNGCCTVFCTNQIDTGNSSFHSSIFKLPKRDSDEYLLISVNNARFQSKNLLSKVLISCNDRILVYYQKDDSVKLGVNSDGLDEIINETVFGKSIGNVQDLLNVLVPKDLALTFHEKYTSNIGKKSKSVNVDSFGWCTNLASKKGVKVATEIIDKVCKFTLATTFSTLKFTMEYARRFTLIKLANTPTLPMFNNFVGSSPVVSRIYFGKECYEKVQFNVQIKGSLEENYNYFTLVYECEHFTGGDEEFIDVSLNSYFNNPNDTTTLYENCSEGIGRDLPDYSGTKEEYLNKIEQILGKNTSDPCKLLQYMLVYASGLKSDVRNYFLRGNEESGANKKPFKFKNGISRAEEICDDDDYGGFYF